MTSPFTAGQKVRTNNMNGLPYVAPLGAQFRITSSSGISSETVVLTSPTVTLTAGYSYRQTFKCLWTATASGITPIIRMRSYTVTGTVQQACDGNPSGTGVGPYETYVSSYIEANSTVSGWLIVGTISVGLGTGTIGIAIGSELMIEQLGPNGLFTTI